MKTEIGFDIRDGLNYALGQRFKTKPFDTAFQEKCKSYSGGSGWYIDRDFGEQSISYQFAKNKLTIEFKIAHTFCYCEDEIFCECSDSTNYESWDVFWNLHYETITLSSKQIQSILIPNLFDI